MDKVDKVLHRVLTILFANISQFKSMRLSCEVGYRDERGQNDIYFIQVSIYIERDFLRVK